MLNLMLHCGAQHVDREQVEVAATPARTRSWVPIPHHRLLDQVEKTLAGCGMRVVNQAHGLWGDGQRYFGLLEVFNGQVAEDYGSVVGLRNSHDKSFPAAIGLGSGVFVCDNLAFSADVRITRKHTRFIERDLPRVITTAVGRLTEMRKCQDERIAAYKQTDLDDRTVHDLAIRSVDARVLPVTRVPVLLEEWRQPRHGEFELGGKTAWRFFNAATEALKGNLPLLPTRTQALHGLLDAECGLAV